MGPARTFLYHRFIPWQQATLFALCIWLGSLVPVQKLGPGRQARKICAVVHGPVYARDHLTINEIKNSITLELQADTEAEAGPVPVSRTQSCSEYSREKNLKVNQKFGE